MNTIARGALVVWLVCGAWAATAPAQLSPEEELKTLEAAPDFEVSLFASEPLVTNPAAIDVDTHGRVWVAEIQWYRGGAQNPPADKIKVLEDTDGDGRADKATVFADGVFAPMSVCVAGDKVYVATSPDLWVYEDKDGDLKADGPPKKLLTGFGGHNHDHGAHSLTLGPDHKWWMAHGDRGFDVQGTDGSHVKYSWGAVLRGELDGSQLETVALNFRNPYEVCVDSFGEAYLSDNDNDGNESVRICWIMEGGNYGWFGGPPFDKQELDALLSPETPYRQHWHFRGHVPGFVPATLVTGFGSPTGICIYESDAFGPKYQDAPLHTDAGPRVCRVYRHEPSGFGMHATSDVFLSNEGDNYFRPDDICVAPNGALYVSDWYDGGVGGHGYNNPEQGRIFLLVPKHGKLARREQPGPYETIDEAVVALGSPNLATQYLARERLLAEGEKSVPALRKLVDEGEANDRARALWVLDRIGGSARKAVVEKLGSPNKSMRALAVRILRRHGDQYASEILPLADDSSDEVRREVLLALPNIEGPEALDALAKIAAVYAGSDRYLLEAINIAAADRKQEMLARLEQDGPLSDDQFALLQVLSPSRAAQRVLAKLESDDLDERTAEALLQNAVHIPSLEAGWGLLRLAQNPEASSALRRQSLNRLVANVNRRGGWSAMARDKKLAEALGTLLSDEELRETALRAARQLRVRRLARNVVALAQDKDLPAGQRAAAIDVAVALRPGELAKKLGELLADAQPAVADAALRGLVDLQDIRSLREIFSDERFDADTRRAASDRLADGTAGAIVLLRLIDEDRLPEELKSEVVSKALEHPDANVRVLFEKFVPEDQRAEKLGNVISADEILALSGDANRGRTIFFKSSAAGCKQCHAVNGFGSSLGPELTNVGKKYDRGALLETILDPSKAIAPEFKAYLLETASGQVYAGFLVEQNDKQVVLKDVKNETIRVPADEVEVLVPQPKSLMPELVLSQVTAQDAADLLAFLTTLK
ncbi:MAG: hypothetical protein DWQ37_17115 [Planctomycetota bacterium]|nr:MAG: hypothetical protein DWQ37_17115 [Planctomycetota bacterium]